MYISLFSVVARGEAGWDKNEEFEVEAILDYHKDEEVSDYTVCHQPSLKWKY